MPLETTVYNSTRSHEVGAVAEIYQTATEGQTTVVTGDVKDRSLWDTAYDTLKTEQHDRIAEYEGLLSIVLARGKSEPVLNSLIAHQGL